MNTPTKTVLTNELKLHDFKGSKLSMTYGDADINDGYSFARINYFADDFKMDFWQDKPVFNIISEDFTLNDGKIWTQFNHGPNSGLNADMVDGHHAVDFKDRYGHHHFIHMFKSPPGQKKFVKIATLVPRKVGTPPEFKVDGTPPYEGKFEFSGNGVDSTELKDTAIIGQLKKFAELTPDNLKEYEYDIFHETDMLLEGVYNATFRANITLLKNGVPNTFDVHLGLFGDPVNTAIDGWEDMYKFFYVSCHDEFLNFIEEEHPDSTDPIEKPERHNYDNPYYELAQQLLKSGALSGKMSVGEYAAKVMKLKNDFISKYLNGELPDINEEFNKLPENEKEEIIKLLDEVAASIADYTTLKPPLVSQKSKNNPLRNPSSHSTHKVIDPLDISNIPLNAPPDPSKDYKMQPPFDPYKHEGKSYQYCLDIMRLYHVDTYNQIVDGVNVTVYKYDLYLCVDDSTEVHVQPYMSSQCLLGNFKKALSVGEIPTTTRYMLPKSIYDKRYASLNHRHYDLEARIWAIVNEIDAIWDMFDNYVPVEQGKDNARKVMVTDDGGRIVAIPDIMTRNKDERRIGNRVFVSDSGKNLTESSVTTDELAHLKGIDFNIKDMIESILKMIDDIVADITAIIDVLDEYYRILDSIIKKLGDVDDELGKMGDYVLKTGDTMTGNLIMDKCNIQFGSSENKVSLSGDKEKDSDFKIVSSNGKQPLIYYIGEDSKATPKAGSSGALGTFIDWFFSEAINGVDGYKGIYAAMKADPARAAQLKSEMQTDSARRGVVHLGDAIALNNVKISVSGGTRSYANEGEVWTSGDLRPGDIRFIVRRKFNEIGLGSTVSNPDEWYKVHGPANMHGIFMMVWCPYYNMYRFTSMHTLHYNVESNFASNAGYVEGSWK